MNRRKQSEREEKERKQKERFGILKIVMFIAMGLAAASGFGSAIYRYFELSGREGNCEAKKLCKEKRSRYVLWRKDRKNCSCKVSGSETQVCKKELNILAPYEIDGCLFCDECIDKNKLVFEFEFTNLSDKEVEKFEIFFFVLDENGEPPHSGRNYVILSVEEEVSSNSVLKYQIDISKWIDFENEQSYFADFLFVSKIKYKDGSIWIDETGLNV